MRIRFAFAVGLVASCMAPSPSSAQVITYRDVGVRMGLAIAEWAKRTTETPELAAQRELADVIALRGGVPIKVGDETIGAVGVSGSSAEGDEKCAMAGLAKVADQLR